MLWGKDKSTQFREERPEEEDTWLRLKNHEGSDECWIAVYQIPQYYDQGPLEETSSSFQDG